MTYMNSKMILLIGLSCVFNRDVISQEVPMGVEDNTAIPTSMSVIYSPEFVNELNKLSSPQNENLGISSHVSTSAMTVDGELGPVVSEKIIILDSDTVDVDVKNSGRYFIFEAGDENDVNPSVVSPLSSDQARYQQVENIRRAMTQEK